MYLEKCWSGYCEAEVDPKVANGARKWVGARAKRKEDVRFVTGRGRYTDDVKLPGMLHAAVLRSPYAHARIVNIDTSKAKQLEGVMAVITGEEAKKFWKPLAPTINISMKVPELYAIAVDKVRFAGEPVAAVAAVSRYVAEDALDLIRVEYEPLPVVTSVEEALEEGAPLLYPEWGDNVQVDWGCSIGDVEGAFSKATHVFQEEFTQHRWTGVPMEGRAAVADYDPYCKQMTVWMSTQAPNQSRTLIAQTLGLPEQNVRVITQDVGGGFGNKLQADAEVIPCLLAMITGRPVKWTESRVENLLSGMQCRDYVWKLQVAADGNGKILGIKADLVGNIGCDGTVRAAGAGKILVAGAYLPGPYKVPAYEVRVRGVVTNKGPYGAYRGYGKDIANFPMERMMQVMSQKLGIPPEELRRRNFIRPEEFPYKQISGPLYDSGNFEACLDKALELIDYANVRNKQQELRRQGKYLGIGLAFTLEPSGGAVPNCIFNGYEPARVRLVPEGGVQVHTGLQNIGQGIETTLAQVVADELNLDLDDVKVIFGDTDAMPYGLGVWSSRGATYGVSAVKEAARKLREKILAVAANMLQVAVEDLEIDYKSVCSKTSDKRISFRELGNAVHLWPGPYGLVPKEHEAGLEASVVWTSSVVSWTPDELGRIVLYTTHPSSCLAVVVEVDIETGQIKLLDAAVAHDCGTVINPTIVEGQIQGGTAQGIGGALMEELKYDSNGQLLNVDMSTYLHPTAMEIPDLKIAHIESPSPFTPLGSKGMGEGPTIAPPAAIANAVEDALSEFGVRVSELPLTPDRVFELIKRFAVKAG
ncbi:MAG: xanthine dehydrogenase family protein molybdopterin-binding subunit [Clostridia bacterium]|nr:xanthine dehydrogenase family protein molybdopterin-binding subunit [Clostridia bacterium]